MTERHFPEGWQPVVHVTGCGGVAFYLSSRPIPKRTVLESLAARYPDGRAVLPGSMAECGSCGSPIDQREISIPPARWKPGDAVNVRARP